MAVSGAFPGHENCRVREFARWDRVTLEHEREYLSRVMTARSFMRPGQADAILHDIEDIDRALADQPKRIGEP
jgi:hypothetical protein